MHDPLDLREIVRTWVPDSIGAIFAVERSRLRLRRPHDRPWRIGHDLAVK